jgi:hypothetical protein
MAREGDIRMKTSLLTIALAAATAFASQQAIPTMKNAPTTVAKKHNNGKKHKKMVTASAATVPVNM